MIQIIKKLRVLLDKKQKRTMVGLIILMVISAFLQTAGVGMLVEVMQIVIDPEAVQHSRVAEACYEIMGVESYRTFSIIVMVLLILVFVVKNLFTYVQQKLTLSFVYTNQFRTSERMMRNYLRRGYEFYLNADTAVVQRSITSDVNNMYALILALLQLLSDSVVSLFVISYCFISSGTMTILMAVVLLLLMWLIKRVLKPIMYKAGKDNQDYYSSLFKWISQTVQGIKEVKISGKEQYFVSEYRKCGKGYVDAVQRYSLYNQVPKLLIETACVATMVGYMIFLVATGVPTENMLTVFGTLAAAALVLLPCVNRINNQINSIAYFEPFFMGVSDNLQDEINGQNIDMSFATDEDEKLDVKESIEMKDITYAYPNTERLIFDHADLKIPVGASVGIVGTSGAGKSTLVRCINLLEPPSSGEILYHGRDVAGRGVNAPEYRSHVGMVFQSFNLFPQYTALKNVTLTLFEDGKAIFDEQGEMLFTHFGISGPLTLSASSHLGDMKKHKYHAEIDLKPALSEEQLYDRITRDFALLANHAAQGALVKLLPSSMQPVMVARWGIDPATKANQITREQKRELVRLMKHWNVPIDARGDLAHAVITSGGVSVREVDPRTMQSKKALGLYFAGEVLDVDAYTGGYNLQIAFCTAQSFANHL